ncbi:hypothetical protein [Shewanella sp. UCD-KL21]|uniref:hypothetical protein n=1 Tax=Shewanella sp. UCD-KL21 TaxID=1917164 RepID=UPI0009704BBB|nr:hypothetical protein [Shewanella sp. UCD-KL21]
MQIGCCWFDDKQKVLSNQSKATTWQLNNNEFWVLSLLAKHRGQVVPIESLSFPTDGQHQQQISEEDLQQIIALFQDYLGASHSRLIELIPNQGVILYTKVVAGKNGLFDSPNKVMSYGQYIVIILLTLIALFFVHSHLNNQESVKPDASREFLTQQGNVSNLYLYTSKASEIDLDLNSIADRISNQLRNCPIMPWDVISATLAEDNKAVSIVMKKRLPDRWRFYNIKVMRDQAQRRFVTPEWLKKVNICG